MATPAQSDREFWSEALTAGQFTPIPRWAAGSRPGTAVHELGIPDDLMAALGRLADATGVTLTSVMLAAHAKVLAALSGECEVTTGYLAGQDGRPVPCRLTTAPSSWRALVRGAYQAESRLSVHQDFPVDALRDELSLPASSPEAVFDPTGTGGAAEAAVLRVAGVRRGGCRVWQLHYRTDALDADHAARIAGYHVTALALIAADPDADHRHQSLLSAEELHFQLEGLAGPRRDLPDFRFHELFEQRARAHPERVAAVDGDRRRTYRELNDRANRMAHALLERGLRRQDVVAVVARRGLDWMAAVLAIFKAGGVYLPIEPHFPADRMATMLTRASCGLVLTEPGSSAALDQAVATLPGTRTLCMDEAAEHLDASDPALGVGADDLAYIYFTSGSTGEPKGAMCEHEGMLNHLYAKIDDLGIGEGQVVAQTAPQCFDISLWQLFAALLVGGRTLVVGQAEILDVRRFLDTIVRGRAAVVQLVPSYLEAVLSSLERHPRNLPDLRCLSVTGEALKREVVQRWFAAEPGITMVNAYGLTETSDDTNHEVMDRAPDTGSIPLGRPVNNVHLYLVDEHLSPVPLGAPGEIAFSGVCVGRGYVNDPERTRAAFTADPYRAGQRLYLSGDFGRWQPEGKLEFLGRRDAQVKIRGFRIETGEVENALLRVSGIRDGAVVVARRAGHDHLVACYAADAPLEAEALRNRLSASLPAYLVPSAFHWQKSLPLTANGKIDKKALSALAAERETAEDSHHPPTTPAEQRLAAAWARTLGIPADRIGRQDHFFGLGGTSLSAIRLAVSLDRLVSPKDLTAHPVLADLARLVESRSTHASAPLGTPAVSSPGTHPHSATDRPATR